MMREVQRYEQNLSRKWFCFPLLHIVTLYYVGNRAAREKISFLERSVNCYFVMVLEILETSAEKNEVNVSDPPHTQTSST